MRAGNQKSGLCTYTRGRVWLPEEPVVELHAGDYSIPLHLVARVALKGDGVPRLPIVSITGPVLWCSRIVASCGSGS